MRTKILILAMLAALLLGACQSSTATPTSQEAIQPTQAAATDTTQPEQAASSTETLAPAETPTPAITPSPAETLAVASGEPMPGCRVIGSQFEPNPTMEALFPAVSEKDWVKGPSDAAVTILDFSDFQ